MTSSAAKKRSEELTSGYGLPEDALALLQEEVAYALDLAEASGRISERAAMVALLRDEQRLHEKHGSLIVASSLRHLGDIIERGEHRGEHRGDTESG